MHQGLAALHAMHSQRARTHYLAMLAETYGRDRQAKEGLSVLAEALTVAHKNGEEYYEAELYRLRAHCCCNRLSQMRPRRKPASSRLWPLPAASRPNPGSYAPP